MKFYQETWFLQAFTYQKQLKQALKSGVVIAAAVPRKFYEDILGPIEQYLKEAFPMQDEDLLFLTGPESFPKVLEILEYLPPEKRKKCLKNLIASIAVRAAQIQPPADSMAGIKLENLVLFNQLKEALNLVSAKFSVTTPQLRHVNNAWLLPAWENFCDEVAKTNK